VVARYWSAWSKKLVAEATIFGHLGYLGEDGQVRCPECGGVVDRADGWDMVFACPCGWRIEDLELGSPMEGAESL
jgi:hypothetical protein